MKEINLNFGSVFIYGNNVAVVEVDPGIQITKEKVMAVIMAAEDNTTGDYALISNRKNAYSTEVTKLYKVLSSRERLKYAAIVSHRGLTQLMFEQEKTIEQIVSKGKLPLELFFRLSHAIEKAERHLKQVRSCDS